MPSATVQLEDLPAANSIQLSKTMGSVIVDGTQQEESRSVDDTRPQPWREWWPPTDVSYNPGPWNIWKFKNDIFDRPWGEWRKKWPPNYSNKITKPQPVYDPAFIEEDTKFPRDTPDVLGDVNPTRINTWLQFTKQPEEHLGEKAYVCKIPPPKWMPEKAQMNFVGEPHQVVVTDIAGFENRFTLDTSGFQFIPNVFDGSKSVELTPAGIREYIDIMVPWIREFVGCDEVFVFNYEVRCEVPCGYNDISRRVHCDQTPRSAVGRIKLNMGERANALLLGRCRLINIWRPLTPVVESAPLGICHFSTFHPEDLIPIDVVFPHFVEEAYEARPSPHQRWYYRSKMTNNDVILLKIYDNKEGVAFTAPHSSFKDPLARVDAPPRYSIELRCMMFGER